MAVWRMAAAALAMVAIGGPVWAQSSLPDPGVTPGALNSAVTQETIGETICVRGWTRQVRPVEEYTYQVERRQVWALGYQDRRAADYEEDHLIPLGLGGAPADERNLWPEPRDPPDGWSADRKDELEARLSRLVCAGRIPLREAQQAIAWNWIEAYRRYVGRE